MIVDLIKIPDNQDWESPRELPYFVTHHLSAASLIHSSSADEYRGLLENGYTDPANAEAMNKPTGSNIGGKYLQPAFLELLVAADLYHPYSTDIGADDLDKHIDGRVQWQGDIKRRLAGGVEFGLLNHQDCTCKFYNEGGVANHCRTNQMITVYGIENQKLSGELRFFFSLWNSVRTASILSKMDITSGTLMEHLDFLKSLGGLFNQGEISTEQEEFTYLDKVYRVPKLRFSNSAAKLLLENDSSNLLLDFLFAPNLGIYFPGAEDAIDEYINGCQEEFWKLFSFEQA